MQHPGWVLIAVDVLIAVIGYVWMPDTADEMLATGHFQRSKRSS